MSCVWKTNFTHFKYWFHSIRKTFHLLGKLFSLISEKLFVKKTISLVSKIDFTHFWKHIRLICKSNFTVNLWKILNVFHSSKISTSNTKKAVSYKIFVIFHFFHWSKILKYSYVSLVSKTNFTRFKYITLLKYKVSPFCEIYFWKDKNMLFKKTDQFFISWKIISFTLLGYMKLK